MKEIWVLAIRTTLSKDQKTARGAAAELSAYDCFEKGRAAMRSRIREFAFSENAMFDGSGGMI